MKKLHGLRARQLLVLISCREENQILSPVGGSPPIRLASHPVERPTNRQKPRRSAHIDLFHMIQLNKEQERLPAPVSPFQLTAFLTRSASIFSTSGVISLTAYEVGHNAPSSRFAESVKPNVA